MKNLFEKYNINISEESLNKFEKYYQLLIEYNNKFNITAITEKKDVYIKHFIDSILGVDNFSEGLLIDIGSGGGFPAIPIKIMKENLKVILVEATLKKCEFLKEVIKQLNLKDIEVVNKRAEEMAHDEKYRESANFVSARAVARLNVLSEYCLPLLKVNGKFVSYKGDAKEEVEQAKKAIETLGGSIEKTKEYLLEDAKRTIVLIKKQKTTEKKYPRSNGKIRKNPL